MPNTKFTNFTANYLALKKNAGLLYAGKLTDEIVWTGNIHEHVNSCEIVLIVRGSGNTHINNADYAFQKGDLLIYNDRVIHSEELRSSNEPLVLYYVVISNFSVDGMDDNKLIPDGVSPVLSSRSDFNDLKTAFEMLLNECEIQELGYEVVTQSLLQTLLIRVLRIVNDQYQVLRSGSTSSLEFRIREYIEKNYMNNLTLKDIAKQFYISQYYLEHLFKEFCDDSPINYMIRLRLERAKTLLSTTRLSIKTIASMTGYESLPYFCVAFKKVIGSTPTEYRNAAVSKQEPAIE